MKPRLLITGAGGLVGQTWIRHLASLPAAPEYLALGHQQLDIADEDQVREVFARFRPHYVINAAAYTQVDQAETEREAAFRANVTGAEILARMAERYGSILLHYSTDYVFDGRRRIPYLEDDPTGPLNYYGYTKCLGEEKIRALTERHFIIRTAWVYGGFGRNFIRMFLKLASENKVLRFVNDQTGSPTAADDLVAFSWHLIRENARLFGTYHCSHLGEATRYYQALRIARFMDLPVEVLPVSSDFFRPKARRPAYSVLSKRKIEEVFGWKPKDWETGLEQILKKYYR